MFLIYFTNKYLLTYLTIDVYVPLTLTLGMSSDKVNAERLRYIEYIQMLTIALT